MAKMVRMMVLSGCPHCKKAFAIMEELKKKHPEYAAVSVEVVDEEENPDLANSLDYWYVPTFFVGGEKIMEGVPSEALIDKVFQAALA